MPSDLEAALAKHRAELDAGERAAADRVVAAYGNAWRDASEELERLLAQVADAIAVGEPLSPAWLYQERRLRIVLEALESSLRARWPDASAEVLDAQRKAVRAAQDHVHELVEGQTPDPLTGTFEAVPEQALADLVGYASDGSPLRALLDQLPQQAGQALERSLVSGLAQGLGPRDIARQARAATGMSLQRALTITRTEQLRAYRESTRRALAANAHVVAGWTWWCACDRRSCAVCWAMHGRQFTATEGLDGHPNCRCAMVPLTKTWEALGFDGIAETRLEPDPGVQQFRDLPEADQLAILGPGKLERYQAGELHLTDLVERPDDPRWGTMRRERSMAEVDRLREQGRLHTGVSDRLGPGRLERRQVAAVPGDLTPEVPAVEHVPDLPAYRRELEQVRAGLPDDPAEWGYLRRTPTADERRALEERIAGLEEHRAGLGDMLATDPDPTRFPRAVEATDRALADARASLAGRLEHDLPTALRHEAAVRDAGAIIEREALERAGPELAALDARHAATLIARDAATDELAALQAELKPIVAQLREADRMVAARKRIVTDMLSRDNPDFRFMSMREREPLVREAGGAELAELEQRADQLGRRYEVAKLPAERLTQQARALSDELDGIAGQAVQLRRDRLLEVLGEVRPMGAAPGLEGNAVWNLGGKRIPRDARTALNASADFYPREWIARSHAWGELEPAKVQRGYYRPTPKGRATQIRLSAGARSKVADDPDMLSVAAHELGHRAENVNPGVRAMEHAFISRRTEGEGVSPIYRGSRERGYRDEFVEHYIGKVYKGGPTGDWEVLSVGMEGIFTGSYDVWRDRDMSRLILGLLSTA